jgi:hypothetical protein
MRQSAYHDTDCNPIVANPTPIPMGFQPALRADVSRAGEACDPGALTCTVFDPMVHPVIEGIKPYLESVLLGAGCLAQSRQIWFHFQRVGQYPIVAAKTRHSGTQRLTLPDNNISKLAVGIKYLCAG